MNDELSLWVSSSTAAAEKGGGIVRDHVIRRCLGTTTRFFRPACFHKASKPLFGVGRVHGDFEFGVLLQKKWMGLQQHAIKFLTDSSHKILPQE